MSVGIKTERELANMRKAGEIVKQAFNLIESRLRIGMTTLEINDILHEFITKNNAKPSFLGYDGFPKSVCVSINEELLHGIPSAKRHLSCGDIVSIDIGVCYDGLHADASRTYPIGKIDEASERLITVAKECFFKAIDGIKEGSRLFEISGAVQKHAEKNGFEVVRDYVGHGIGRNVHEDPSVPNYADKGKGIRLYENMTLAIEPMLAIDNPAVEVLPDKWTVITKNRKRCSHYENTIIIKKDGVEIIT
jgi:methionyl aminopeptidase